MFRFARLALVLALMPAAFAQQPSSPAGTSMVFTLTSSAFNSGAAIPTQYSCEGSDVSPSLTWSGAPAHTVSFALIVDDPDAPAGTWVHWLLWNLPASAHSLDENVGKTGQLGDGVLQGRNDFRKIGYNGPCPPAGRTHRYFFRLYALDAKLGLAAGVTRSDLDAAMQGHILGHAEYMGTFRR